MCQQFSLTYGRVFNQTKSKSSIKSGEDKNDDFTKTTGETKKNNNNNSDDETYCASATSSCLRTTFFYALLFNQLMRGELCVFKKRKKEGAFEKKKMPTFSLSSSLFFRTLCAPLKKNDDRFGGFGGKGEKIWRKREKRASNDETVVVVVAATTTNFERKSRREALVSFPSLTSAFVVFFSLLNDADASVEEWSEEGEITSCAYFDIGLCESIVRAERALGGDAVCSVGDAEKIGRVKIGLFGKKCPDTEKMFRKLVESGAYDRTVFHDIRKGEFIAFGANGSNV